MSVPPRSNFADSAGPSDAVREILNNIAKTERPEADVVRDKISAAFPQEGLLVHWHRGSHGRPAHYTIMAPEAVDPNTLVEKLPPLGGAEWGHVQYVERWSIAKDFFSKGLTKDIKREQPFASFTPQITGNIRHQFHEMNHAQFSGESGTHYIIDGVEHGMDPQKLLPGDARIDDPAQLKRESYWKVKVSEETMREALDIPAPVAQRSPA